MGKVSRTQQNTQAFGVAPITELPPPRGILSALHSRGAWAGVGLLFVAACAWGVLEVHYSTDTWIGLAAGRQIVTEPSFPTTDTFSYTFYGQVWFNQNWLSHVFFWLLYDKLGPTALVIGTWTVGAGIFTLVLGAAWFRCRSWLAAFLAAAVVAIAMRDWLSIRPATIQFFLLAAAWLSLSALLSQGERRRWWAIALLLPIYGLWPHAHGSFLFGFGLLGLFLGCAAFAGLLRRSFPVESVIGLRQGAALAGVGLVTAALAVLLSPYGIENLTHPFKIVESDVFRRVGEWMPPYRTASFPGVLRFWIALALAVGGPLVVFLLRVVDSASGPRRVREEPSATNPRGGRASVRMREARRPVREERDTRIERHGLNVVLFDIASVGIGLYMAIFARRFAPVFLILTTPALSSWIVRLAGPLSARMKRTGRGALMLGAWVGAATSITVTSWYAYKELVTKISPTGTYDLLDRVTLNYLTPMRAMDFLRRNGLKPNVMTEWKVAAAIMFYVPGARVFIDGRAQQVYSEQHFLAYGWLLNVTEQQAPAVADMFDRCQTDVVLLPRWGVNQPLTRVMDRQPQWMAVLEEPQSVMWARRGSAVLAELQRLQQTGNLWVPAQVRPANAPLPPS